MEELHKFVEEEEYIEQEEIEYDLNIENGGNIQKCIYKKGTDGNMN